MTEVRLKLITEDFEGNQEEFVIDTPFFRDWNNISSMEWFADQLEDTFRTFDLIPSQRLWIDAQGKFIPRFSSTR